MDSLFKIPNQGATDAAFIDFSNGIIMIQQFPVQTDFTNLILNYGHKSIELNLVFNEMLEKTCLSGAQKTAQYNQLRPIIDAQDFLV